MKISRPAWSIFLIFLCFSCSYHTYEHKIPDPNKPVPVAFQGEEIYVAPSDASISVRWGDMETVTYASSMHDGAKNTITIVNKQGSGKYAAFLCDTSTAFGFTDWYLPSVQELDAINKQSYLLKGMNKFGYYWSSTEASIGKTWVLFASKGQIDSWDKNRTFHCRCVRRATEKK